MVMSGINPDRNLVEIGELKDHPFFLGTQFHPELSMERNRERFHRYIQNYVRPEMPDTAQQMLASFRETPQASSLLRRYVQEML